MYNSDEELWAALRQLEQSIYNHERWHKDLTRTIICRLPYDYHDVAENAHRQCHFGQWYYNNLSQNLRDYSAFVAIEIEHERMHQLAAQLLRASANEVSVSPNEYDHFCDALDRLRLQLLTLKREIEDSLYNRDPLTGAESRIGMLTKVREMLELVKRRVQQCCIAIMDLDHFKAINDTYGHAIGDHVLSTSVRYVKENLRPYDKVFRYGGEEFLISLPDSDLQDCPGGDRRRIREGLAAAALAHDGPEPIFATASFGITLLDPDPSVEKSIDRADKAMYAAKTAGRNRTCISGGSFS